MIPLNRNIQARLGDELCIVRNFLNDGSIEVIWRGGEVFTCQLGDLTIDLFNLSELFYGLETESYLTRIRDREPSPYYLQIQKTIEMTRPVIISSLRAAGLTDKQICLILEYVKGQKEAKDYQKICLLCIDLVDLYCKMGE